METGHRKFPLVVIYAIEAGSNPGAPEALRIRNHTQPGVAGGRYF